MNTNNNGTTIGGSGGGMNSGNTTMIDVLINSTMSAANNSWSDGIVRDNFGVPMATQAQLDIFWRYQHTNRSSLNRNTHCGRI
jgi:hypothetical protein